MRFPKHSEIGVVDLGSLMAEQAAAQAAARNPEPRSEVMVHVLSVDFYGDDGEWESGFRSVHRTPEGAWHRLNVKVDDHDERDAFEALYNPQRPEFGGSEGDRVIWGINVMPVEN